MIQSEDTVLVLGGARVKPVPPASRGRQDLSLSWGGGSPQSLPPSFPVGGSPLVTSQIGGCVDTATGLVSADSSEQLGNYFQKY